MNVQDDFFCIDLKPDCCQGDYIGLWSCYLRYLELTSYEEKKEFVNSYFIPMPKYINSLSDMFNDLYYNFFIEAPKDMNYTHKASLELEELLTEKYCFQNNLIFSERFQTIKFFIKDRFKSIRPVVLKSKTYRYLVVDFSDNVYYYAFDGKCYDVHGVPIPDMDYKPNII